MKSNLVYGITPARLTPSSNYISNPFCLNNNKFIQNNKKIFDGIKKNNSMLSDNVPNSSSRMTLNSSKTIKSNTSDSVTYKTPKMSLCK